MKSEAKRNPNFKPGFLERWGRKVLVELASSRQSITKKGNESQEGYLSENKFHIGSQRLIISGVFWSFWIGFLPSVLFVFFLGFGPGFDTSHLTVQSVLWFLGLLIFWTVIEFYLLFRLGFFLAYKMAELAEMELANEPELYTPLPSMLARIVLEIPDPRILIYGIDPYKHLNKRAALVSTILYKSKVFLSNISAKFILKAIIGRSSLRYWIEYISGPITGLWDSITTYIILRELQKRIITRKISNYLLNEITNLHLSQRNLNQIIRTVALAIVFTKTFHPNFEFLILRLVGYYEDIESLQELDNWEIWLSGFESLSKEEKTLNLKLFAILSAFDGKLNREEKMGFLEIQKHSDLLALEFTESLCKKINEGKLIECLKMVREFWT